MFSKGSGPKAATVARIRLAIGSFLASTALMFAVAACSDESDTVTCVVNVGGAQTTVPLIVKVGASAVATVGDYSVAFSVGDGRRLEAEVRDADSTLMKMTTGDAAGTASGSTGTPDGQLEFSCAP